jgi:streptogramin lyase
MQRRFTSVSSFLIASLTLAIGLASRSSAPSPTVTDLNVKIREWTVPTKGAHPHDPAVGTDGSLWFTEQMVSKLGRLDPAT